MDPAGDLHLSVGKDEAARFFVVCSKSLARSAPFWKTLLYGGFFESKKPDSQDQDKTDWVVKLPEDDPKSMELLLNIVHGRFEFVPEHEARIPVDDLYNLCVLADKYDMVHMLRPWARGWSKTVHNRRMFSNYTEHCKLLWISWVFGDQTNFEHTAKVLLCKHRHPHDPESLEPPGIYERMEQIRLDTITELIAPFRTTIQGLIENDLSFCVAEKKRKKSTNCIRNMLGAAIQYLHGFELWPIPSAEDVDFEIEWLANSLKEVDVESGVHDECTHTPRLQEGIDKTLGSIPSLLTETECHHLRGQAKKSGLAVTEKKEVVVGKDEE
ncbi:hypothetical protein F4810DRAFT_701641 [Camillea tinctor]|nr:hypothetical protein F4810DRAFT_701641 [Camillea tinctor]